MGILSSSAWIHNYLFGAHEFMDKTPQLAKEKLIMTMNKAEEAKLQRYKSQRFGVFG